ncbi:hypothetical protein ABZY81_36260 [Streptomyces sp. NPDC006514]|uniref:hypothetical protein n=1 Tax=Streptomyces sp. NPDC006514 TaxID=3154308 RepID=UPI0033BE23D9
MGLSVRFGPLVREDLQSVPGPARAAAETALARLPGDPWAQLDACLADLAAGEPKRAPARLTPSHQKPRITAALTAGPGSWTATGTPGTRRYVSRRAAPRPAWQPTASPCSDGNWPKPPHCSGPRSLLPRGRSPRR